MAPSPTSIDGETGRPLVSVIIPAYNVARYLPAAIDSALAQTYPRVEIVVVDDGSTDATPDVIAGYGSRIVAVRQENLGPGAARNRAIAASHGDVLALLDSDDVWLPHRLDRMVTVLEQSADAELVTSDLYILQDEEFTERRLFAEHRKRLFPADPDLQVEEITCRNFMPNSVVFRRDLVERHGGFEEDMRVAEDYELWTRYIVRGVRALYIDEPLGYYRIREGSYIRSGEPGARHLAALERHLPALWKLGARGHASDAFAIGTRVAARGDRRGAVPFFVHAVTGEGGRSSRARYAVSSVRLLVQGGTAEGAAPA